MMEKGSVFLFLLFTFLFFIFSPVLHLILIFLVILLVLLCIFFVNQSYVDKSICYYYYNLHKTYFYLFLVSFPVHVNWFFSWANSKTFMDIWWIVVGSILFSFIALLSVYSFLCSYIFLSILFFVRISFFSFFVCQIRFQQLKTISRLFRKERKKDRNQYFSVKYLTLFQSRCTKCKFFEPQKHLRLFGFHLNRRYLKLEKTFHLIHSRKTKIGD